MTTGSDVTWYDAPELDDGPEEFLLDADERGPESRIMESEQESASDSDDEALLPYVVPDPTAVARRSKLPALPPGDEGSLFTVLKKNVGKVRVYVFKHLYSNLI